MLTSYKRGASEIPQSSDEPKMLTSYKRDHPNTLFRADSEIEVEVTHYRSRSSKRCHNKSVKDSHPSSFAQKLCKEKETSGQNSSQQEDTEGSSIIDLRERRRSVNSKSPKSRSVRSRSLDTLERPKSVGEGTVGFEQRMSFHSSLQDLSSDELTSDSHEDDPCRRPWSQANERRPDPIGGATRSSWEQQWSSNSNPKSDHHSQQVFMKKKPMKHKDAFHCEKSSKKEFQDFSSGKKLRAHSPTFSFRSSLSLLPSPERKKGLQHQIIVTVACSLAPLACGFAVGYVLIKNPKGLISPHTMQWTHLIFILGAIIGSFFSGIVSNFGRKLPLFLSMSLLMLGWLAIIFTEQVWIVLTFHGLSGLCTSLVLVLSQIYIAEIATPTIRGSLSSSPLLALHIGLLIFFITGDLLSWKTLAIIGVSSITPFFLMIPLCMPESPRFLIHKNPNAALATLQWLRGGFKSDVMEEYRKMADNLSSDLWSLDQKDFGDSGFWKPLTITCTLMMLLSMSGIASIVIYSTSLFQEMSYHPINVSTLHNGSSEVLNTGFTQHLLTYPNSSLIIIISIIIIGIILSAILVDQVGRKLLLLLSLTIMAASAFALGLFLFLKEVHRIDTSNGYQWMLAQQWDSGYQWASEVFCIVLFTLANGSAIVPITWLTLSEIFGTKLKWVGVSISTMVMWSSLLMVDMAYHRLSVVIATGGLFWFHCIVCVGGYIFILLFFRELRGHKLDDVAKVFQVKNQSLIDTFITKA